MSEGLSCYAVSVESSRGRAFPEKPHPYRSDFERDRDRIIHCSAFRRLEGKAQVFTPGLDDYYRTRLTLAKELGLNESLTEAICLAHDLGHSPFGHNGEKVLNDLMGRFGGFEHNRQALRIVDLLEHPYPDFMGLNLMFETRLGLAKHRSTYDKPQGETFDEKNCSLIGNEQLKSVRIFNETQDRIGAEAIKDLTIRRTRTAKAIIDKLVSDCLDASKRTLAETKPETVNEVYARSENLIVLSTDSEAELAELEGFLMQNFYLHESLIQTAEKVKTWLEQLFERLCREPELMPGYFQRFIPQQGLQRAVCDYIAGMTDRFCLKTLDEI
jgi:dGTPase